MADFHIASKRRFVVHLADPGTVTVADDQDLFTIPFLLGKLIGGTFAVLANGSSSGGTEATIERHRAGSSVNMLGTSQIIAHDSSVNHLEFGGEDIVSNGDQEVEQGDQVGLNIDAIPGGSDSTWATMTLVFQIIKE